MRRMTHKTGSLLLAAMLSLPLAGSQVQKKRAMGGPPRDQATEVQMRVDSLARMLDLTDAQKSAATAFLTQAQAASESIESNLREARQSLADAIKQNNTTAIDALSVTIGVLTGQLTAIDGKAQAALYATLTADQQAKYDMMPRGGPGGPGGRMGPGGFGPPPGAGPGN
ncbi:MAG: Spy/CpxP family protein refolding chaperone [Bryobacteraceae bacterium]